MRHPAGARRTGLIQCGERAVAALSVLLPLSVAVTAIEITTIHWAYPALRELFGRSLAWGLRLVSLNVAASLVGGLAFGILGTVAARTLPSGTADCVVAALLAFVASLAIGYGALRMVFPQKEHGRARLGCALAFGRLGRSWRPSTAIA